MILASDRSYQCSVDKVNVRLPNKLHRKAHSCYSIHDCDHIHFQFIFSRRYVIHSYIDTPPGHHSYRDFVRLVSIHSYTQYSQSHKAQQKHPSTFRPIVRATKGRHYEHAERKGTSPGQRLFSRRYHCRPSCLDHSVRCDHARPKCRVQRHHTRRVYASTILGGRGRGSS